MKINNVPVICAECVDVGKIVAIRGVNHLSCGLMNDRPVFGSKPIWCPRGSIWPDEELKKVIAVNKTEETTIMRKRKYEKQ